MFVHVALRDGSSLSARRMPMAAMRASVWKGASSRQVVGVMRRRKLVDSRGLQPAIGDAALALIGRLFAVERQADEQKLSANDRLALRQEHSVPVLAQLQEKSAAWKSQLLPKHPLAQALGYIQNQWGPLTVFTRTERSRFTTTSPSSR